MPAPALALRVSRLKPDPFGDLTHVRATAASCRPALPACRSCPPPPPPQGAWQTRFPELVFAVIPAENASGTVER